MTCPKCKSTNVTTQITQDIKIKNQHKGVLWWCFVGWWWLFFKWLFLTLPALILKIFGHKKQNVVTKNRTMCVCQECGHTWEI